MKQVVLQSGQVCIEEVPTPQVQAGEVLVAVRASVVSTGTEMSGTTASTFSFLERLARQPGNVKRGLRMLRREGFLRTLRFIQGTALAAQPTGYSAAGQVIEVGEGIDDLKKGDRVACAGAGIANHAEVIAVPRNLAVPIPEGVSFEDAASATIGAIALQGVRRADPKLGEFVAVIGLGLLGQLTVQILKAAGCRVVGIDVDPVRVAKAKELGCDWALPVNDGVQVVVEQISADHGVDATIITAATPSNAPVKTAMEITRKKGRVVVVGAVGLQLERSPFYEKEIDFLISCSYGPGRYDPSYESGGLDYPYGYVRWTENRNMQAYLAMIAQGTVRFQALIDRAFPMEEAPGAYEYLKVQTPRPFSAVLTYGEHSSLTQSNKTTSLEDVRYEITPRSKKEGRIGVGLIGAGAFAQYMHLPLLRSLSAYYDLRALCDHTGLKAKDRARRFGFAFCTTDPKEILQDASVNAVFIMTRHDTHAALTIQAARAGKAVFVEKPMSTREKDLVELIEVLQKTRVPYLTGLNRRFSPSLQELKKRLGQRQGPLMITYRVDAGFLPAMHWVHTDEGGGRIVGEGCHMLDVFRFLVGQKARGLSISPLLKGRRYRSDDNVAITVHYEDGSVATLLYVSSGDGRVGKERLEVFCEGNTYMVDDFTSWNFAGEPGNSRTQDKGHKEELVRFAQWLQGISSAPIPLEELVETTRLTFTLQAMINQGSIHEYRVL